MPIEWFFPPFNGGVEQGFGHPGIQHFEGDHASWVAREAIQNSLDAKVSESGSLPVIVEFELTHIDISEVPGIARLKDIFRLCRKRTVEIGGDTPEERKKPSSAISFFDRALAVSEKIPVLTIRDFNTTGLAGDDESRSSQWYRLIRSSGVNQFRGDGAGSHGIGKFAPFAASFLRSVFYSTVSNGGTPAFIGKSILTSFDNGTDECDATGFYCVQERDSRGRPQVNGMRAKGNIPSFFRRSELGTTLFILGYRHEAAWEEELIASVLKNYYAAIHKKQLIVRFKDAGKSCEIDHKNIKQLLEELKNPALPFYLAISDETSYGKFKANLPVIGECSLYVLKGADPEVYTKEVVLMRKNLMEVDRLSKRVLKAPFVAVFVCENPEGNKILRELEPPDHNKWDKNRRPDGAVITKGIDDWIKEKLKELRESSSGGEIELPGLSKYLPGGLKAKSGAKGPEAGGTVRQGDQDTGGEVKGTEEEKAKELNFDAPPEAPVVYLPALGEGGDEPGGEGKGDGTSDGNDGKGNKGRKTKRNPGYKYGFRWVPISGNKASVIIHPNQKIDKPVDAYLFAAGEDAGYKLNILSAVYADGTPAVYAGGTIKQIVLENGRPCKITVKVADSSHIAVGVKLI